MRKVVLPCPCVLPNPDILFSTISLSSALSLSILFDTNSSGMFKEKDFSTGQYLGEAY